MDIVNKKIILPVSQEKAFEKFVDELNNWWPKSYTWSKKTLNDIFITPQVGHFCTEIGPNGFRIDWGTIIDVEKPNLLIFKWQIGFNRDPIPNPDKASLVTIEFKSHSSIETTIELTHSQFEKHGDEYLQYLEAMDSNQGWSFILDCFKTYIEK